MGARMARGIQVLLMLILSGSAAGAVLDCSPPTPRLIQTTIMSLWEQDKLEDLESYLLKLVADHPQYVAGMLAGAFYSSTFKGDSIAAIEALRAVLAGVGSDSPRLEEFRARVEVEVEVLERIRNQVSSPAGHGGSPVQHAKLMREAFASVLLPGMPPPIVQLIEDAPQTFVGATAPPAVSVTSPLQGSAMGPAAEVLIRVDAAAAGGAICDVAVRVGGMTIGTDQDPPYEVLWGPAAPGTYTLDAVARDFRGGAATSAGVTVERE